MSPRRLSRSLNRDPAGEVEVVGWQEFLDGFRWRQGEHVSLIGPTGAGKTTLGLELLPLRRFVVVVATKPRDRTLGQLRRQGYKVLRTWPAHVATDITPRVVLWPRFERPGDVKRQRKVIAKALAEMFAQGSWAVFVDELRYISSTLRLSPLLELYWQQGRSIGLSLIGGTQRPAHVPLMLYDQATHLFFWRDNDEANLRRIGGIGWMDSTLIRETVAALPRYAVLYVNTRTGAMVETKVELNT